MRAAWRKEYDHRLTARRSDRLRWPAAAAAPPSRFSLQLLPAANQSGALRDWLPLLVAADAIARRRLAQGEEAEWHVPAVNRAAVRRLPELGLLPGLQRAVSAPPPPVLRELRRRFLALCRGGHVGCAERAGGERAWFLRAAEPAAAAAAALEQGTPAVFPEAWRRSCLGWLGDVRRWRIAGRSRGIASVPAWICPACGVARATELAPSSCPCGRRGGAGWRPGREAFTPEFAAAALPPPAALLVAATGAVAPASGMLALAGAMGEAPPWREALAVGSVRMAGGGAARDPFRVALNSYGADALRIGLLGAAAAGRDLRLTPAHLRGGRRLAGKLWSAGRFVARHRGGDEEGAFDPAGAGTAGQWALHRLNIVVDRVNRHLDAYRLRDAVAAIAEFVRRDLCGRYLEMVKCDLQNRSSRQALGEVLDTLLRLVWPFMPGLAADIGRRLQGGGRAPAWPPFPRFDPRRVFPAAFARGEQLGRLIGATRSLRGSGGIAPRCPVELVLWAHDQPEGEALLADRRYLERLCGSRRTRLVADARDLPPGLRAVLPGWEVRLRVVGAGEARRLRGRLQGEADGLDAGIARLRGALAGGRTGDARSDRRRLQQLISRRQRIGEALADLP